MTNRTETTQRLTNRAESSRVEPNDRGAIQRFTLRVGANRNETPFSNWRVEKMGTPIRVVTETFPHIPGIAAQTAQLVEFLRQRTEVTATDSELENVIGIPVGSQNKKGYAYEQSAIGILRRRYGQVWKRMAGEGLLRRLNATETAAFADDRTRHIRRQANRTVQMLECHDITKLEDAERSEYLAKLSQNKLLTVLGDRKTEKKLVGIEQPKVDMHKLLDALKAG